MNFNCFTGWMPMGPVRRLTLILFLLAGALPLDAAVFNIGDGDVGGLRAAIAAANSNNQDDTINLAMNGGYYIPDVNNSTGGPNGLPIIDRDAGSGTGHSLTITGNGATVARSFANGVPYFRILYVANGVFANQHPTTISNVVFTNSVAPGSTTPDNDGGAIYVEKGQLNLNNCTFDSNKAVGRGGAIFVHGQTDSDYVVLTNCTLSNNTAGQTGAAIESFGPTLTLSGCALYNNATANGPGGAIEQTLQWNSQVLNLTNCTVSGNTRPNGGSSTVGDAIFTSALHGPTPQSIHTNISNCTFNQNKIENSYNYTGGVRNSLIVTLSNTLLAGSPLVNSDPAGSGGPTNFVSNGYNLSNDNGAGFLTGPGDQITVLPKLDPAGVKNNGGPTPTIALLNGSPAVDMGKSFGVTTDQRGFSRPYDLAGFANAAGGDGSDIGAYETRDPVQNGGIFAVNTTADHDDGVCGAIDCTLREAVAATNALAGANTINLNVAGIISVGAIGQIAVTDSTTISGPGARSLAISGGGVGRVFNFSGGTSTLSALTVRDGFTRGNAIVLSAQGGGLSNAQGTLTVNDCTFLNNEAAGNNGSSAGSGGGAALGGAVYNFFGGVINLNRCTFTGNTALGGSGAANSGAATHGGDGGAGEGGAILNDTNATLNLTNCTVSGNTAVGGVGGNDSSFAGGNGGAGEGAVYNRGTISAVSCTIADNTGSGGNGGAGNTGINHGAGGIARGGLVVNAGSVTVSSSLVAENVGSGGGKDVDGAFTSGGYNLIGTADHSSGFTGSGDQIGTDASPINAQLGGLANYGGDTDNVALNVGSPAIDHGSDAIAPHRDQRNYLRTGRSDVGAFEYNGSLLRLVRVTRNGQAFQVYIEVVKGKTYSLQRKQVLSATMWQSVLGSDKVATGNDTEFVEDADAFNLFNTAFYQAIAQ